MADVGPLEVARVHLGMSMVQLWTAYFALGGVRHVEELADYLTGTGPATTDTDHDTIVQALNEALDDRGEHRTVPYSRR